MCPPFHLPLDKYPWEEFAIKLVHNSKCYNHCRGNCTNSQTNPLSTTAQLHKQLL